jgi:hypothetical protein
MSPRRVNFREKWNNLILYTIVNTGTVGRFISGDPTIAEAYRDLGWSCRRTAFHRPAKNDRPDPGKASQVNPKTSQKTKLISHPAQAIKQVTKNSENEVPFKTSDACTWVQPLSNKK